MARGDALRVQKIKCTANRYLLALGGKENLSVMNGAFFFMR